MAGIPFDVGAHFALAAVEEEIKLTRSLEGLAMIALYRSTKIEDTMMSWLRKWGH
jgi:hypothetical protein